MVLWLIGLFHILEVLASSFGLENTLTFPQIHQNKFLAGMAYISYSKSSKLDVSPAVIRPLL